MLLLNLHHNCLLSTETSSQTYILMPLDIQDSHNFYSEQFKVQKMRFTAVTHKSKARINQSSFKILATILLLSFFQLSSSLHIQAADHTTGNQQYDKSVYYYELYGIESRFKNDLNKIKDQFTSINLQLNNTNITASDQVIYLQETLADERDALFNIQTYLNVPFALRSCQCINVTQQQKDQIEIQIQNVSQSIKALQASIGVDENGKPYENPKCPEGKCAAVDFIKSQITQMKQYVQIMNDTITSECCKIVNYVYRDNLVDSDNWIYGGMSEQAYRLSIFERSKDTNLTQCPKKLPFVNLTKNECFNCTDDAPFFNLQTRKCEKTCKDKGLILNKEKHNCEVNKTCEENEFFSEQLQKCQVDLGTASVCPKATPIWNEASLACQKCPKDKPYYDIHVQACRKCTENENWNIVLMICANKNETILLGCPAGTFYNQTTKQCQTFKVNTASPNTTNANDSNSSGKTGSTDTGAGSNVGATDPAKVSSGTFSLCPPDLPYWSTQDYACKKCPEATPSFNATSKQCQKCPNGTTWISITSSCLSTSTTQPTPTANVTCLASQVYNLATKKCEDISSTGQIGMCPPETPFWDPVTMICDKCESTNPYWNATIKKCTKCPIKTVWDASSSSCKSTAITCPPGQILNSATEKCEQIRCVPQSDKPIYNAQTYQCEPCPQGTTFNNKTLICESNSPQRTNISVCPKDTPYWNNLRMVCEACPTGQSWNTNTLKCQKALSHQRTTLFEHQANHYNQRRHHMSADRTIARSASHQSPSSTGTSHQIRPFNREQ